ncbi:MAG: sulfite exporter TauE/SafE family protein [Thermoplasmata archaeon]
MFDLSLIQIILSIISGLIVGFSLGLIGGGGSILAIPLLIYLVGYNHPHTVIGTTALAVGINAYLNLIPHARKNNVKFKPGIIFSIFGVFGVLLGAQLGLITPGKKLLFLFAIVMIIIAINMYRKKCPSNVNEKINKKPNYYLLILYAFLVGFASGYFGIGGGFMIVPSLMYGAGLNILNAIGTSLLSVGTFGITTAIRYSISGKINIFITILYISGGIFGGWIGAHFAHRVPRMLLTKIFAIIIIIVAIYMIYENATAFP